MDKSKSLGLVCVALLSWGVISAIGEDIGAFFEDLARPQPDTADFYYVGDDDGVAAGLLEDCLLRNSAFKEMQLASESVSCNFADSRIHLGLHMANGRLVHLAPDRVVITSIFGGKVGNLRDRDALAFVNTLNDKQNAVRFYWDVDGDLVAQSSITFENLLTAKLLQSSVMMHHAAIAMLVDKLSEQLERYGVR